MTLKKPDGNKRCLAPCPKDQPCECRDYIDCIERQSSEIDELKAWKESALSVMNKLDLQAIGKEIGAPLGSDIARQILPAIRALIKANKKLEYLESDNAELRERVKELEAIVGETYEPSKYNDGFLQWVDKYFAVKPGGRTRMCRRYKMK